MYIHLTLIIMDTLHGAYYHVNIDGIVVLLIMI